MDESIEAKVDEQTGAVTGAATGAGGEDASKSKAWTTSLPKEYRERLSEKFGSMEEVFRAALGEQAGSDAPKPEGIEVKQDPPEVKTKSLEETLREMWGDSYTVNMEKAKRSLADLREKHPSALKGVTNSDGSLSADALDLLAALSRNTPDPVANSAKGTAGKEFDFQGGVRNRFNIPGV